MRGGLAAVVVGGVATIGIADFLTGTELRVFPFYYVPLSVAAWYFGRVGAGSTAALCTLVWLGTNYAACGSRIPRSGSATR